ncbi:efflux RND transporter periplasmic adaptor subunit [Piscinibacter koreensis]|uniref:Efflux RND transporter periplasmic adaptor subunit n=1 Tax=Piscinibacter koreensis TaxID=2742824 RepID=A0A7Y6NP35_9BURK|nr:efflux RND transporter periplasmic adaptor subunit [Schlegelella koreensis]NUZ06637.1 efflux RND transporter periplasmic adaptor subunit [Schlegelella koreensis]
MTQERHAAIGIHAIEPGADDHGEMLRRRQIARRTRWIAVIVLALLALGAARTIVSRMANAKVLESTAGELAKPYVKTAFPKQSDAAQKVVLPGTLQGAMQSPIAARSTGYLKRWTKDIGSRVEKGELLAEIESPEVDQQLLQAAAARQQAAAALEFAKSTVARWEALRQKDVVSQQELDEKRGAAAQASANLAAADANVQRLRQLQGFKRVVAPFSGVITKRNVDVGDLIDVGGQRVLFVLTQADALRVYVNVPQSYAQLVKAGQPVVVTQAELRGQRFEGKVARTAAAIDAATRTMQVEVALPNREGLLLPGAYVQVELPLEASRSIVVPNNALLFRAEGARIAVVDGAGKVRLQPVTLGRNLGETVEVLSGVGPKDRMVLNPTDSLADGDEVAFDANPAAGRAGPAASAGARGDAGARGEGATGAAARAEAAAPARAP